MTFRISLGIAALGALLFTSCYPYNENQGRGRQAAKPPQKMTSAAEQQQVKEQRERLKKEEAVKKTQLQEQTGVTRETPGTVTGTTTETTTGTSNVAPKPPAETKPQYVVANKVPGKDGFVFSPYNNKVVDVRDIPTGTLVQDPTYAPSEKKYFRVP